MQPSTIRQALEKAWPTVHWAELNPKQLDYVYRALYYQNFAEAAASLNMKPKTYSQAMFRIKLLIAPFHSDFYHFLAEETFVTSNLGSILHEFSNTLRGT